MGFKANQSEAVQGSELKPEGDYECIIVNCEERTTRNNATGLNFSLVIRNDIAEQKYKNAYLFYTLWKRRQPSEADMQVNGYSFGQVMAMGKGAGLPDGKDYENLEEFCNDLMNKPIRVTVKHSTYNGNPKEEISYVNVTKYPAVNHIFKPKSTQTSTGYAAKPQAFAGNNGANSTPSYNAVPDIPVPDDDDIPF